MKSRTRLKMGNDGSKARSLGQILEKEATFQSDCHDYHETWSECLSLDEILDEFKNGS